MEGRRGLREVPGRQLRGDLDGVIAPAGEVPARRVRRLGSTVDLLKHLHDVTVLATTNRSL
jgi:hypothetical protein